MADSTSPHVLRADIAVPLLYEISAQSWNCSMSCETPNASITGPRANLKVTDVTRLCGSVHAVVRQPFPSPHPLHPVCLFVSRALKFLCDTSGVPRRLKLPDLALHPVVVLPNDRPPRVPIPWPPELLPEVVSQVLLRLILDCDEKPADQGFRWRITCLGSGRSAASAHADSGHPM